MLVIIIIIYCNYFQDMGDFVKSSLIKGVDSIKKIFRLLPIPKACCHFLVMHAQNLCWYTKSIGNCSKLHLTAEIALLIWGR